MANCKLVPGDAGLSERRMNVSGEYLELLKDEIKKVQRVTKKIEAQWRGIVPVDYIQNPMQATAGLVEAVDAASFDKAIAGIEEFEKVLRRLNATVKLPASVLTCEIGRASCRERV